MSSRKIQHKVIVSVLMVFAFRGGRLAVADQILFKNGDKLTGKIQTVEGGKLTIASALAGTITVDLKNINTFSTDAPIRIKMEDGRIINQKIATANPGEVTLAPGGPLPPQTIPLSKVKWVNFPDQWHGTVNVGGTLTRGNTDNDTLNIGAGFVRRTETDRTTLDGGYLFARQHVPGVQGKHESANDWWISGKYDYFFTPKFYGYLNGRVEQDLIANISLRLTPGGGVGYQWFDRPDFHLSTEGGVSWLYRDYRDDGTDESVAIRLAYHVDKKLNDKVTVFHDMEYFPGLDRIDDFYFNTDAGVRATITSHLFTEFKALYKYDARTAGAPGSGHTDTQFILGVGWKF